ncbi:hypothetical protein JOD03_001025 [Chryseomicrobium aureum]|uniref:nuclease-related domain-containing protein n=1 Tax=Chryseomicrobium aureum TaxID=1441723 RepID=UPI001957AD0D|nr:nuclease-related domain-containing protein [Chryseomicrobium aureum]MBM7706123.1 hypothetical protein [Chryseomicrobium aureum]
MKKTTTQSLSYPTINRPLPQEIDLLKDFQKRLPEFMTDKYQELENQIKRIDSGYHGELKIDGHLSTTLLPDPHFIFPGYHAKLSSKRYVQIDTLILTPSYILHLEIKNIRGKIELLQNPSRLKRTSNLIEEYFSCPITQLKRNHYALHLIFRKLSIELPPIYPALIFANRNCEILTSDTRVPIFFPLQIEDHISKLNQLPRILTKQQLTKIRQHLQKIESPYYQFDLAEKNGVGILQLKRGVICGTCNGLVRLNNRKWSCVECQRVEINPIPRTLQNLLQLSDDFQKPAFIREWLQLRSQKVLYRARKELKLEVHSHGKGMKYRFRT